MGQYFISILVSQFNAYRLRYAAVCSFDKHKIPQNIPTPTRLDGRNSYNFSTVSVFMTVSCASGNEPFRLPYKLQGISCLDEELLAFQEGLCSVEIRIIVIYSKVPPSKWSFLIQVFPIQFLSSLYNTLIFKYLPHYHTISTT